MANTVLTLVVSLDAGNEVLERKLYDLTTQVLKDVAKSGVDSVRRARDGEQVIGGKGFPIDVNTLLITVASAGALTAVISLLRDWILRAEGRKVAIRVQAGDKTIEFEYTPTAISEKELMSLAEKLTQMLDKPNVCKGA